jgi:phosphohistidine swiveling domain-containing protein
MQFTRDLAQIALTDIPVAGGKGASLGHMLHAGLPVPDGFVVLSTAFDCVLAASGAGGLIEAALSALDYNEPRAIKNASTQIRLALQQAQIPQEISDEIFAAYERLGSQYVAVRSSATAEDSNQAAWAGQLESYLNTSREALLQNVKNCWASLFNERALFYRFNKSPKDHAISVAVIVQKMVQSEVAGVAFSVNPLDGDRRCLIIEAALGLGEAVVSGQITPSKYVVEKSPLRIAVKKEEVQTKALRLATQGGSRWFATGMAKDASPVLPDDAILLLAEQVVQIEELYGFPCDIEWAYQDKRFYIVQSRPITTLPDLSSPKPLYEKIFARDYCLALIQAWCGAESTDPRQWTDQKQPVVPYIIFERKKETVNCYMDLKNGTGWVKDELSRQAAADPDFVRKVATTFCRKTETLKTIWLKEQALELADLRVYLKELEEAWAWFEALWWLMEITAGDQANHEILREARLATERIGPGSDAVITKSSRQAFPEIADYASVLLIEEIASGKIPCHKELEARMQGYFFTDKRLFVGKTLHDIEDLFKIRIERPACTGGEDEIRGESAYAGYASGTVRRIMGKKTVLSLKPGEILVTAMTTPEFLPALEKAAAFVTDEGGITCHAAIIAREFKKPCIIGTKVATELFKSGDRIEVDADNGVVRRLLNEP